MSTSKTKNIKASKFDKQFDDDDVTEYLDLKSASEH